MAILPLEQKDDEKEMETLGGGTQPLQEAPTISGAAPSVSTESVSPTTTSSPTGGRKGSGSGTFQGIRKYVQAGQGSGGKIGEALGQKFSQKAGAIGTQVQQAEQKEQQKIQQAQQGTTDARTFALQQLAQAGQGQAPEEADITKFRGISEGTSTPELSKQLQVTAPTIKAKRLQQQAEGVRGEEGRFNLLQDTFGGRGGYTSGESRLDQLLLQRSPEAVQQLTGQVQGQAKTASQNIEDARRRYLQDLVGVQQGQRGLREEIQTGLTGAQEGLTSDIQTREQQLKDALNKIMSRQGIISGLSGEQGEAVATDLEALQSLGIDAPELYGQRQLYGVDPSKYLDLNASTLATPEDLARAKALASLAGTEQTLIPEESRLGETGSNRLNEAIARSQAEYQQRAKEFQVPMDNLQASYSTFLDEARQKALADARQARASELAQKYAKGEATRAGDLLSKYGDIDESKISIPDYKLEDLIKQGATTEDIMRIIGSSPAYQSYRTLPAAITEARRSVRGLTPLRQEYGISGYKPSTVEEALLR